MLEGVEQELMLVELQDQVDQVVVEMPELLILKIQEVMVQQILEVEEVELLQLHLLIITVMVDQEVQVLLLLELQDQQIFLQDQEQTQLRHYQHQLEVVKLRHSRFLEHLQLANYLLFTNPIKIII
jgi:hypothetical protein